MTSASVALSVLTANSLETALTAPERVSLYAPDQPNEGGEDPLLTSLTRARDRMLAAERDPRLLITYAREFTEPRRYRLEDLARAAGMSISGIWTAYDDNEIGQVASITGL